MRRFSLLLISSLTLLSLLLGPSLAEPTPIQIKFADLYSKVTANGVDLSPKLQAANGKRVEMLGYMAPPLKPKIDFFVLSKVPLETCPFCATAADWPTDIVLVLPARGQEPQYTKGALAIRGRLELGVKEDPDSGFVSLIRIYADQIVPQK
jgi:hypothetical protein